MPSASEASRIKRVELAKERGAYASFSGSLWSQGILPIDSLKALALERGEEYLDVDTSSRLNWDKLRAKVQINGMRNSNVMAIAPTATIANITGVSQSIEPTYQNLYVKSNLSGEFTVVNRQPEEHRARPGGAEESLCHGVRGGAPLARGRGQPAAEVDRSGAVPESVHR